MMQRIAAVLLATTAALAAPGLGQESRAITLTPQDAYAAAVANWQAGRLDLAAGLTDALLQRSPGDVDLLILKSRIAEKAGEAKAATTSGRQAWGNAETDSEKYAAAMVTARALLADEKHTRAQLWLRRAAHVAPNDAMHAQAARDFRVVRARNPWAVDLNFNIAPTNNVNNGSARETTQIYLFGLPFEIPLNGTARALSGLEYAAGGSARYRFKQTGTSAHDLIFQLSHRTYTLSSDARDQAPGAKGSDFAFTHGAIGYVFHNRPPNGLGPYSLRATAGQTYYGGDEYLNYLRFGGAQSIKLNDKTGLSFSGAAERQYGIAAPDADILRGDLRLSYKLGNIGTLGATAGHTASFSDNDQVKYSENRLGLNLHLAKPILGADVSFGLEVRQRDYPVSAFTTNGREDTEVSASINLVMTEIEKYGFNPTLSINSSQTSSNIGRYDSSKIGVSFGIRSAF